MLLHSFFHLNLAYSAIEQDERPTVVERCYWPLLELAEKLKIPIGVELSGLTLEEIQRIDPLWIKKLCELLDEGLCELIGSGYSQIIGPLVPAHVTQKNLALGNRCYEDILSRQPSIALINEQAYSAGLVGLYKEAGYSSIVMEWNNPASTHPEWGLETRFLPQQALGPSGDSIHLIWNKSITFQKFQRYVHSEIELDDLMHYLEGHLLDQPRALALYGNDVEIFDFRPGRYMTEAPLPEKSEWSRVEALYKEIKNDQRFKLIRPSGALDLLGQKNADQPLRLECSAQPVPVKKQNKYNLLRWAVTGRDDLRINTRCQRLARTLQQRGAGDEEWRELCYLWSSDFRTHITERRWAEYLDRLQEFEKRWIPLEPENKTLASPQAEALTEGIASSLAVRRTGRILEVSGKRLKIALNCQKGLALESFIDQEVSPLSLCGTLHHGYFDDIRWGADFYSGHLVFEGPGAHKLSDLAPVEPEITYLENSVQISTTVETPLGRITKCWLVADEDASLQLNTRFESDERLLGTLRCGHVTLNPQAFDQTELFYRTHNGGSEIETFSLAGEDFDHGRAVSFLVSAQCAVGLTENLFEFGDNQHTLRIEIDRSRAAVVGLVTHQEVRKSHFTRLSLTAQEVDDTSKPQMLGDQTVSITMQALKSEVRTAKN